MRAGSALLVAVLLSGCSIGPRALEQTRLRYNEVVKTTTEEQLLLNIVRLRYADTPSSLAVSTIAAQFELIQSLQLTPFFLASGAEPNRSYTSILPQLGVAGADRPTFSLTPLDDTEFTRKLFTPLPLDGVLYLAKTTWPISTVFRLYLENLNWVPNAELASGPTPAEAPPYADFLRGVDALGVLQRRGQVVFGSEERIEKLSGALPAGAVTARDALEAAKGGYEYRPDEGAATWTLIRRSQQPVMHVDPRVLDSPAWREFALVFRLRPGTTKFDITSEALVPFGEAADAEGITSIDLETRSLLQALYFVSHGVEIPREHDQRGLARRTVDAEGRAFDWSAVTRKLFRARVASGDERPAAAHVAVPYKGYWFYIEEDDLDSKTTFSLLMQLARLELVGKTGVGPVLTLPLGGR